MTKRKPAPEATCPYCGITFLALTRNDLANLALSHHEGEHPEIVATWPRFGTAS